MWMIRCYSQGDLTSDRYLADEYELEDGGEWNPKFRDVEAIQDRIEFIDDAIERLAAEKEVLTNYYGRLVDKRSWHQVLDDPIDYELLVLRGHPKDKKQ